MHALARLARQPLPCAALLQPCTEAGGALPPAAAQLIRLASFNSVAAQAAPAGDESNGADSASAAIRVATLLERLPVVMPPLPQWELEYAQWQQELVARYRKPVPGWLVNPKRSEDLDAGPDGASRWRPAPVETAADRAGDRRSLRRRLDQRLFFLVRRRQGGAAAPWEFPSLTLAEGETTRAGAERALAEAVALEGVQPFFIGNAPAGHVPRPGGGGLFFHRCQLIQGTPGVVSGGAWGDHVWAAKDELSEYIKEEDTLAVLKTML